MGLLDRFGFVKYEMAGFLERLGDRAPRVRDWVLGHAKAVLAGVGVLGAILAIWGIAALMPAEQAEPEVYEKEWYYDLNTRELFAARAGQTPPIEAPSGPTAEGEQAGVRAVVMSYEKDPNMPSRKLIAYLETTAAAGEGATVERRRLVRRVEDERWYPTESKRGRKIFTMSLRPDDKGRTAWYVRPE